MTLARQFVQALRASASAPLSPELRLAASLHFIDAMGVGLAAAGSPVGLAYREVGQRWARGGPATVLGQSLGATPADFIRATYRELQEKDAAARGVVAGDMLLPTAGSAELDA